MEIPVFAKIIGGVGILGAIIYLYSYFMDKDGDKLEAHQDKQKETEQKIREVTKRQDQVVSEIKESEEKQQDLREKTDEVVKETIEDMKKPATSIAESQRQIEADWGDL